MSQEVRNPDPAWPEIIAVFLFWLIAIAADGLSSWPLSKYFAENWLQALKIVLWVWVPMRVIDLLLGGPSRRKAMRVAYRSMIRHINGQSG